MKNFSEYLLNYMERFFTKKTDLATIILALVATIVTVSGLIDSFSIHNQNLPYPFLASIPLGALIVVIIIMGRTNYNKVIFDIERSIFQHQAVINDKNEQEQLRILERLQKMFSKKPSSKEIEEFKKLLSGV